MSEKQKYINLLEFLIGQMERLKDNPSRDSYCLYFDEIYEQRKTELEYLKGE